MATLVTNTEKQTAQSAMDEEAVRDLVGRLAQLADETTMVPTTLKMKEISQTHNEGATLGKPKVFAREPRNRNEWSFIREVYNAAGKTQFAQGSTRIQDGGNSTAHFTIERDRQSVDCKS